MRDARKDSLFMFHSKNKDNNPIFNILTRKSFKDKESDTSKLSEQEVPLRTLTKEINKEVNYHLATELKKKHKENDVMDIFKEVKNLTDEFKKIIY